MTASTPATRDADDAVNDVLEHKRGGREPSDKAHSSWNDIDEEFQEIESGEEHATELRDELNKLKQSYAAIQTLLDVGASLNSTLNLQDLLKNIVDGIV